MGHKIDNSSVHMTWIVCCISLKCNVIASFSTELKHFISIEHVFFSDMHSIEPSFVKPVFSNTNLREWSNTGKWRLIVCWRDGVATLLIIHMKTGNESKYVTARTLRFDPTHTHILICLGINARMNRSQYNGYIACWLSDIFVVQHDRVGVGLELMTGGRG